MKTKRQNSSPQNDVEKQLKPEAPKILEAVREQPGGMTSQQINALNFGLARTALALKSLFAHELITTETEEANGGEKIERYVAEETADEKEDMRQQNLLHRAQLELDKPLTNRGFLIGCALLLREDISPIDEGEHLMSLFNKAKELFMVDYCEPIDV